LPQLPNSLTHLNCTENYLTTLPNIPISIEMILCSRNPITKLPRDVLKMNSYNIALFSDKYVDIFMQRIPYDKNQAQTFLYDYTPIHHIVNTFFDGYIDKYFEFEDKCEVTFANKIGSWFLDCKYNPKYKYCQNRLKEEFKDVYLGNCKTY